MSMDISLIKHGNEAELKLNGYIDAGNAAEAEKVLVDVAGQFDKLTLDMEKLEYVSSAGLRAFKRIYMDLRRRGGVLSAKNVDKSIMEVLEVTGFTRLFRFI
ncbi:MAG: STAS domain-containing protein [Firmicutes bacterium]|nr:STAS domain-containing protein [Bacillota bacterium]